MEKVGEAYGTFLNVENLGPAVNTTGDQYPGWLTEDGKNLYFMHGGNDFDFFVATREAYGKPFGDARRLEGEVNVTGGQYGEFGIVVLEDGKTMYFSSDSPNMPGAKGSYDIYRATRQGDDPSGPWGDVQPVLAEPWWDLIGGFFRASKDTLEGSEIYFWSDRWDPEWLGAYDLWAAVLDRDGLVSEIRHLGSMVNSYADDACPSLSKSGLTLFFSDFFTARPGGCPGNDIHWAARENISDAFGEAVPLKLPEPFCSTSSAGFSQVSPVLSKAWPGPGSELFFSSTSNASAGWIEICVARFLPCGPPAKVVREFQRPRDPKTSHGDFLPEDEIPVTLRIVEIRQPIQEGDEKKCEVLSFVIEETFPKGWTVKEISPAPISGSGEILIWEVSGSLLKVGGEFKYTLVAPASPAPSAAFQGKVLQDRSPGSEIFASPVSGDSLLVLDAGPIDSCGGIRSWNILGAYRQPWGDEPSLDLLRGDYLTDGTVGELDFIFQPGAWIETQYLGAAAWCLGLLEDGKGRNPGGTPTVFAWNDPDGRIALSPDVFGSAEEVMAYAQAYIHASEGKVVCLGVSSDDSVQVFLNEEEVWVNSIERMGGDACEPQDLPPELRTLVPGENRLLLKVFNGSGGWDFSLRFQDASGNAVTEGLEVKKFPQDGCRWRPVSAVRGVDTGQVVQLGPNRFPAFDEPEYAVEVRIDLSDPRLPGGNCAGAGEVTITEIVPEGWRVVQASQEGAIDGRRIDWQIDLTKPLPELRYTVRTGGEPGDATFLGFMTEPGSALAFDVKGDILVKYVPPKFERDESRKNILVREDFESGNEGECPQGWACNRLRITGFDPGITWEPGHEGRLRLTKESNDETGTAIFTEKVDLTENSFKAACYLYISKDKNPWEEPSDGMTFLIVDADRHGPESCGYGGRHLGYGGLSGFAVEIDLWRNQTADNPDWFEPWYDPSGYNDLTAPFAHVAVLKDGITFTHEQTQFDYDPDLRPISFGGTGWPDMVDMNGGGGIPLRFELDYNNGHIQVSMAAPKTSEPAFPLQPVLDTVITFPYPEGERPLKSAYFGFSAATAVKAAIHEVDEVEITLYEKVEGSGAVKFQRGDANADGQMDISDVIFVLSWLFVGGPQPDCVDAADVDDVNGVDITDGIYLLDFLFRGGPEPEPPYPGCGEDSIGDDDLTCVAFAPCSR